MTIRNTHPYVHEIIDCYGVGNSLDLLDTKRSMFVTFPYIRHFVILNMILLHSGWTPDMIESAYWNIQQDSCGASSGNAVTESASRWMGAGSVA